MLLHNIIKIIKVIWKHISNNTVKIVHEDKNKDKNKNQFNNSSLSIKKL